MADADHTAIGQALGFVYQFERATYRLLQASTNVVSVSVEYLDDVSEQRANGMTIREQNKATTMNRRPLTDRSTALWKTLAIWTQAVVENPACLETTEFHIVTNGEVASDSLARRIHNAKSEELQIAVAEALRVMALDLRDELSEFGRVIQNSPNELLAGLVGRLFVFDRMSTAARESLDEISTIRYFGEPQRIAIFESAMGWIVGAIQSAARKGEPTTVDRRAFDQQIRALVRRVQVAPLAAVADISLSSPIDPTQYEQHGFFQQLEWIDTDPDFTRECVIHFVHAKAIRIKWTDTDTVSEASVHAYEEDLKSRWRIQVQRQRLRTFQSPELQGQELLLETLSDDVPFDGQTLPRPITCGNYHALADFDAKKLPDVGWHPEYLTRSKKKNKVSS